MDPLLLSQTLASKNTEQGRKEKVEKKRKSIMNSFITQAPAEEQANILLMTNTCIGGFDSIYRRKAEKINKTWKINWATHSNSLEPAPECFQNIPLKNTNAQQLHIFLE